MWGMYSFSSELLIVICILSSSQRAWSMLLLTWGHHKLNHRSMLHCIVVKIWLHQDDDMCPNYQGVPARHPQLLESIPKPPSHLAFPELPSIPKMFPTWHHISPTRGLYHSEVLTSPGSSPFQHLFRSESFSSVLHSETLSVRKASTLNLKLLQQNIHQFCRQSCNSIFRHVYNV